MAKCRDIISFIEKTAKPELAETWDNSGLLAGSAGKEVKKMLLCLDATAATIKEAIEMKADMMVTHHPLIFRGISRINPDEADGRALYEVIRSGICVYSAHTSLDHAEPGVNTQLAAVLGIRNPKIMGRGPGRYGTLDGILSLDEFAGRVKKSLNAKYLRIVGNAGNGIRAAAVFGGSFDGDLDAFRGTGADVLVTGDLKYHIAVEACESGICIIDAGHFATEAVILPLLKSLIDGAFADVEAICSQNDQDPFTVI